MVYLILNLVVDFQVDLLSVAKCILGSYSNFEYIYTNMLATF
jgi:hypothetical protein